MAKSITSSALERIHLQVRDQKNEVRFVFDPFPDITPLELAQCVVLFHFFRGGAGPLWTPKKLETYLDIHKIDRHFKKERIK